MNTYPYRTYAEIDLNKMQHNLRQVRAAIGPDCKLLFVLKADAYGHGTPVCAKYSEELVDWYAVATIDEALSIRRAGVEKPILLFGALQDPEIELAADNRITINSCSLEYSRHVAEVLQRCGKRMDCHIKIDRHEPHGAVCPRGPHGRRGAAGRGDLCFGAAACDGHLYAFFLRGQCGPGGRGLYADTV